MKTLSAPTLSRRTAAGALAGMLAIGMLVLPLTGCSSAKLAAKVNGEKITQAQLDSQLAQLKIQSPALFQEGSGMSEDSVRAALLDELVNRELLTQEAAKRKIEVTDAEVDKELETVKSGYTDEAAFTSALEAQGYTLESAREQIKWYLLSEKLLANEVPAKSVTDAEVKTYYEANPTNYTVEAAKRASHILFDASDKATAEKVLAEVKAGGDFAALAKKYSQDPGSAKNGGDLGWPTVAYVKEFEAAVADLKVGEISDLVKTEFGYHIITVTAERKAGLQPLADVKADIAKTLLAQKRDTAYNSLLEKLRKAAKIEIIDAKVLAVKNAATDTGASTEATAAK